MSEREVILTVRRYLENLRIGDISFEVDESRVHRSDGWWRVAVRPSRWPEPLYAYYDVLAEVEEEIAEKEGLQLLIVTSEPREVAAV